MRRLGVAILAGTIGVNDDRAAEAFGLHLLQVVRDGSLGDIAVEPPPIGAQTCGGRRIIPAGFQRRGSDG